MICNSCNAENKEGALFCENCGTSLEQAAPVAEVPANEPVAPVEAAVEVAPVADPGKTLNLIALILGIASLVIGAICPCSCPYVGWLAYVLVPLMGAASIILGVIGMKKSKEAGLDGKQGKLGMILGIAGIAVLVVMGIISLLSGVAVGILGGVMGYMEGY